MGRYKPNGIPWEGKSAVVPIAAVEDMRKMNHNWNWLPLEEIERTCRNVSETSYGEFVCSECGLSLDLYGDDCGYGSTMVFFEGRKAIRTLDAPNFCPNCGAKVVE